MAKQCELYRHFDRGGQLLYVGISYRSIERMLAHSNSSHWFDQVTRIEIERFPSRRAALDAEMQAIKLEKPACNIVTDTRKGIRCRSEAKQEEIDALLFLIDASGYSVRKNSCLSVLEAVWESIKDGEEPEKRYLSAYPRKPAVNRQTKTNGH